MTGIEPPAIVTLTTDFGTQSSYVGSLRGALLSISPRIVLADISHDVPPFDVMHGAILLHAAAGAFPRGTVHLAVVDPGVGGERRPIAVRSGDYYFVGPDNGLFTPFLDAAAGAWELDPGRVSRGRPVSATFHGRDLFAPAAARLALRDDPEALGDPITDPVRLAWPEPAAREDSVVGVVLHVDPFGNIVTNIGRALLGDRRPREVKVAGVPVTTWARTYDETKPGTLLALIGSGGLLEIAENRGNAARRLKAGAGAPVIVQFQAGDRS